MQQITEQQITAMAPNPAAASNGRKISQKGGFVRLERSEDDSFYMGECKGSGLNNYITSVDFQSGEPVCRCSCPSRQFPCKHGLALLYEILAKKKFDICQIPDDILKKREKKQAKDAKAKDAAEGAEGGEKKKQASKSSKAAKTKKLKKQLEGLDMLEKLVKELLRAGLGTFGGASISNYKELSKQLGDYYLPGPQRFLNGLILEMEAFQKDGEEIHYDNAVDVLERLWTLVKKSRSYLNDMLKKDEPAQDDNMLYEELGGVWKLSELEELGRSRQNISLMQLAFWVSNDLSGNRYIDTGCWADLSSGEIYVTYNYRPFKALKYIKEEDSMFGVADVPMAACYPGEGNLRIRWDEAVLRPAKKEEFGALKGFAAPSLSAEVKGAKNILKNAMADDMLIRLIAFEQIGCCSEGLVLKAGDGSAILLGDAPGMEASCDRVLLLPDEGLVKNQALLGAFFYDRPTRRFKCQPLSIITENTVVRLLY